jgi:hypothetical protein
VRSISGDQHSLMGDGMGGDGRIEVLDALPAPFEKGLDGPKALATIATSSLRAPARRARNAACPFMRPTLRWCRG